MNFIKCEWYASLNFNQIHVIGKVPLADPFLNSLLESLLLVESLKNIEKAEKSGECIILSYIPATLQNIIKENSSNNSIVVAFTIMFKDLTKAKEFYQSFKR